MKKTFIWIGTVIGAAAVMSLGFDALRKPTPTKTVSVVGEAFVNPYTRFQSLMGITLTYNVFDFGVRKNKMDMAKEDILLRELLEKEQYQE